MNDKTFKAGYILALGAALFYALQVVVNKFNLSAGLSARDLLVITYTGGTLVLMVVFLLQRKKSGAGLFPEKRFWMPLVFQGVIGAALTSFFFFLAMEKMTAGICSMLLYLCPIYVCIFFMATGIRKISFTNKLAVGLAFAGAVLVLNLVGGGSLKWSAAGIFLGLLSGLCYAFYSIHADLKLKEIPAMQMLFYMYVVAVITFWILNPGFLLHPPHIPAGLMPMVAFAIVLQVLPLALINLSIRMIGSNKTTVIATLELPLTILLAFLILGEKMNLLQIIGIGLVLAAVVIIQVKKDE
ncbi:MAG: EamA family transporter [Firmicutes bacterium]|nr:EamA family transporter [Bacillota bacterium]